MTQKAALCKALLKGQVLSIMTGFRWFSITNVPREVSRQIEQVFMVKLQRTKKDFTSKYGQSGYYYEYRLLATAENAEGRILMESYVRSVELSEFQAIIKKGAKKKHCPENEPIPLSKPSTKTIQKDLFS